MEPTVITTNFFGYFQNITNNREAEMALFLHVEVQQVFYIQKLVLTRIIQDLWF